MIYLMMPTIQLQTIVKILRILRYNNSDNWSIWLVQQQRTTTMSNNKCKMPWTTTRIVHILLWFENVRANVLDKWALSSCTHTHTGRKCKFTFLQMTTNTLKWINRGKYTLPITGAIQIKNLVNDVPVLLWCCCCTCCCCCCDAIKPVGKKGKRKNSVCQSREVVEILYLKLFLWSRYNHHHHLHIVV